MPTDDALFTLPATERVPLRRVIVLAGASGSGKSSVALRLGIPQVRLDDFYRDLDEPGLPRRHGIVDWDNVGSWNLADAVGTLLDATRQDTLTLPVYDIPTSRRTGSETLDISGAPALIAEGIFAAHVVAPLRAAGVLAGAFYLSQPRTTTAVRRFARDVGESRKPLPTLVRRGLSLWREEPKLVAAWRAAGLTALPRPEAEQVLAGVIERGRARR